MAEGKDSFKGLAVPLFGDFEIKQRTAATDVMTISGASGQRGDFIVCQNSSGAEKFTVGWAGYIGFGTGITSAPSTGIVKGDMFTMETSTYVQLALGQTANTLRYVNSTSA
jgi:hypothetical protein